MLLVTERIRSSRAPSSGRVSGQMGAAPASGYRAARDKHRHCVLFEPFFSESDALLTERRREALGVTVPQPVHSAPRLAFENRRVRRRHCSVVRNWFIVSIGGLVNPPMSRPHKSRR